MISRKLLYPSVRQFIGCSVIAITTTLLASCGGGGNAETPEIDDSTTTSLDGLTPQEAAAVATLPNVPLIPEEIVLRGGITLSEAISTYGSSLPKSSTREQAKGVASGFPTAGTPLQKVQWIEKTLLEWMMYYSCNHPDSKQPCDEWMYDPEGTDAPKQTHLAYVWESADVNARRVGGTGASCKTMRLYGFDCSGLMLNVADKVGVSLSRTSALQAHVGADSIATDWKFPPTWGVTMKRVADGTLISGDVVAWKSSTTGEINHIGVLALQKGVLVLISSTGGQTSPCDVALKKGPRPVALIDFNTSKGSAPYIVLRASAVESTVNEPGTRFDPRMTATCVRELTHNGPGGISYRESVRLAGVYRNTLVFGLLPRDKNSLTKPNFYNVASWGWLWRNTSDPNVGSCTDGRLYFGDEGALHLWDYPSGGVNYFYCYANVGQTSESTFNIDWSTQTITYYRQPPPQWSGDPAEGYGWAVYALVDERKRIIFADGIPFTCPAVTN